MPKMPTLKAAAALSALAVGSACSATDEELASLVAEDVKHPVRPAGVDGQPVWNDNAIWFQYPPVLRFSDRQDVHYRVRIFDSDDRETRFTCKDRLVSFEGVWAKIPCGKVEVWAEMTQPNHGHCIRRVFRTFWKMRPFAPGAYPKPPRTYAEASRLCYEYVYGLPSLGKFLETCCHGV